MNGSIRSAASRVFIVWYKHGQEPIRLHELSQVFKNPDSRTKERNQSIGWILLTGHAWYTRSYLVVTFVLVKLYWLMCVSFMFQNKKIIVGLHRIYLNVHLTSFLFDKNGLQIAISNNVLIDVIKILILKSQQLVKYKI